MPNDSTVRLRPGTEDAATPARPPTPPPDPAGARPAKDGTDIATPATAIDFPIRDERTPIIAFGAGDLPVCTLFSAGATPMQAPRLEVAEQSNEDDQRNRNPEEEQQNRAHIATSLACGFEWVFV